MGYYIDGQLAGSWGQGHRFYLNGPFFTPADGTNFMPWAFYALWAVALTGAILATANLFWL